MILTPISKRRVVALVVWHVSPPQAEDVGSNPDRTLKFFPIHVKITTEIRHKPYGEKKLVANCICNFTDEE